MPQSVLTQYKTNGTAEGVAMAERELNQPPRIDEEIEKSDDEKNSQPSMMNPTVNQASSLEAAMKPNQKISKPDPPMPYDDDVDDSNQIPYEVEISSKNISSESAQIQQNDNSEFVQSAEELKESEIENESDENVYSSEPTITNPVSNEIQPAQNISETNLNSDSSTSQINSFQTQNQNSEEIPNPQPQIQQPIQNNIPQQSIQPVQQVQPQQQIQSPVQNVENQPAQIQAEQNQQTESQNQNQQQNLQSQMPQSDEKIENVQNQNEQSTNPNQQIDMNQFAQAQAMMMAQFNQINQMQMAQVMQQAVAQAQAQAQEQVRQAYLQAQQQSQQLQQSQPSNSSEQIQKQIHQVESPKEEVTDIDSQAKIKKLESEVAQMKALLAQVIGKDSNRGVITLHEALRRQEVDEEILNDMAAHAEAGETLADSQSREAKNTLVKFLKENINFSEGIKLNRHGVRTVALLGTTGVGKTTTLAKIAAKFVLEQGITAALITADTYRISAVEQLRTYSDILGLPLEIVYTPAELTKAINKHRNRDLILIDTAGRSQHNDYQMKELQEFLAANQRIEKHIVLSTTTKSSDANDILEKFSLCEPDKIIFTKTDETASVGLVVNLLCKQKLSISYLTNGQSVPDDITPASAEILADLLLRKMI